MKKITSLLPCLLLILFIFSQCDKEDTPSIECSEENRVNFVSNFDPEEGRTIAKFFENKSIGFDDNGNPFICDGENWVFYYERISPDDPMIADDEITQRFMFEVVPPLTDSFLIEGSALEAANTHYFIACFCPEVGYFPSSTGSIDATQSQTSGDWEVTIDVEYGNSYIYDFKDTITFEK